MYHDFTGEPSMEELYFTLLEQEDLHDTHMLWLDMYDTGKATFNLLTEDGVVFMGERNVKPDGLNFKADFRYRYPAGQKEVKVYSMEIHSENGLLVTTFNEGPFFTMPPETDLKVDYTLRADNLL